MPLPEFNSEGDLPIGIHRATMEDVIAHFGRSGRARLRCGVNLRHIYELAKSTGEFERLIVFGSFITAKPVPNDVDVILVMRDAFNPLK